jgi:hypothetical protein
MITLPADAPAWAVAMAEQMAVHMRELINQDIRRLEVAMARRQPADLDVMITARQADVHYRLRMGTARAAWERGDGTLRGKLRKGRSSTGQVLYLNRDDCERIWGAS